MFFFFFLKQKTACEFWYGLVGAEMCIRDRGEGLVFADTGEVQRALDAGQVELAAKITVRMTEWTKDKATGEFVPSTSLVETTVGRALLSEILPKGLPFSNMNLSLIHL